ncbi:MAG: protease complex subunit PrcB family protein [Myxococcales bacterium]|nr:protease complex subunit PrcB family protein [Myxococcales bacterium]
MNREHIEQYLAEYVDGTLPAEDRAAVEDYLEEHPEEAETVRLVRRVQPLVRALPDAELPLELSEKILAATTRQRRFFLRNRIHKLSTVFRLAPVVGVCLVAIVVGVVVVTHLEGTLRSPDLAPALEMAKTESALPAPAEEAATREAVPAGGDRAGQIADQLAKGSTSLALKEQFASPETGQDKKKDANLGPRGGEVSTEATGRLEGKYAEAPAPTRRAVGDAETQNVPAAAGLMAVPPPAPSRGAGGAVAEQEKMSSDQYRRRNEILAKEEADEAKSAPAATVVAADVQRWEGQYCGVKEAGVRVVVDPGQWSQLWRNIHANCEPQPPLPAVDFKTQAVVAVFMGIRPTGGFAVRIQEVRRDGANLVVTVRETEPRLGQMVTEALTQPYSLVVVPRSLEGLFLQPNTTVRIVKQ